MTITTWVSTHYSSSLVGDSGGTFLVPSFTLSPNLRPPHSAFIALTLFDLGVLSIRALRFNNAQSSSGTCSCVLILMNSLGSAVKSSTVQYLFKEFCFGGTVGCVAGWKVGLGGENNTLTLNSVLATAYWTCKEWVHSFCLALFLWCLLPLLTSHNMAPLKATLFGSRCHKFLFVQTGRTLLCQFLVDNPEMLQGIWDSGLSLFALCIVALHVFITFPYFFHISLILKSDINEVSLLPCSDLLYTLLIFDPEI